MLTLDTILKDTVWVAKMVGYRDKGTMDEIGFLRDREDCRDFDLCAEQPEHLKEFYDKYFEYEREHGFTIIQDFYNDVYSKEEVKTEVVPTNGTEVLDAYSFILGGKSEFTIKNLMNNKEFKYKVSRCKNDKNLYFVRVKGEGGNWSYAGCIRVNEFGEPRYSKGNKGLYESREPAIKGIMWALGRGHAPLTRPMILLHHGKCACCGKKLDDNDSVKRGFGPVCWSRLSGEYRKSIELKMSDMIYA